MKTHSKEELVAALEQSRRTISMDLPVLGRALNPALRLKSSLSRHPARWIACSAVIGFVVTKTLAASGRRAPRAGGGNGGDGDAKLSAGSSRFRLSPLLLLVLKSAFDAARPAATRAVKKRLNRIFQEDRLEEDRL